MSGKAPTRALLFDVGGTLDADGDQWRHRFRDLFIRRGHRIPAAAFDRAYFDSDDHLPWRYPLGSMSFFETVRALTASLVRHFPGAAHDGSSIAREFYETSLSRLRKSRAVLSGLRPRFRVGLVSNYYGNLEALLRASGLDEVIDAAIDSESIGVKKPHPEIFLRALESVGARPSEALFIGDSFVRDILGSARVGIQPVWVTPCRRGAVPQARPFDVVRIRSVEDLPRALSALNGRYPRAQEWPFRP